MYYWHKPKQRLAWLGNKTSACFLDIVLETACMDVGYHGISVFFYLSAAVLLANVTISKLGQGKVYQLDIAAVVKAFIVTLL
ncbi:hypothetical protein R3I94_011967 [Phoxinus phoxinus]